jgi:hypothetical protein
MSKRHCPRCGKPTAIVVTAKQHDTELGQVQEQNYRCEDCFLHFKMHSPKWDAFWAFFAVCMLIVGVAVVAGVKSVEESQRTPITLLLFGMGVAAGLYALHLVRIRKKAPLVGE